MSSFEDFINFHGQKGKEMVDEYVKSLENKEDINDISTKMNNINLNQRPEKKENKKTGRKCGKCGECGHNRRTCKKVDDVDKKVKESIPPPHPDGNEEEKRNEEDDVVKKDLVINVKKQKLNEELFDESKGINKCDKCNNECSINQFIKNNSYNYCYNCYKTFIEDIEVCKDCNKNPCDCTTDELSDIDSDELISDIVNDYITYEGIKYYYDEETNILANDDYEEIGEWIKSDEQIEWYNDEYKTAHELCKKNK